MAAGLRLALVIHPGALGDVLLAIPALRALRPLSGEMTIAAQPRIGALLCALGVVDHVLSFDTLGLDALFGETTLAAESPLARRLAGAPRVVCWFGAGDAGFVRRLGALAPGAVIAPPHTTSRAVWEHLVRTLGHDGAANREPIVVNERLRDDARALLRAHGWDGAAPFVVVHPGAGSAAKRWPAEAFAAVTRDVNATLVLSEGPADHEAVERFTASSPRRAIRLVDLPLATLAAVQSLCRAYIGNDSGVSHLAAAVGAPSLILFAERNLPWVPWFATARCVTVTPMRVIDDERDAVGAALSALVA
jgi:heptosyltransferase III